MPSSGKPRQERPLAEQHEEWIAHLRRHAVSRRTIVRGAVGAAAGSLLLGGGAWSDRAVAATLANTGTIAGGFVVNGRHLSFGNDPTTEMRVGGQLVNLNQYNMVPPRSVRVWVDYGADRSYGSTVEAEIRELLTHVPVWDGKPGVLRASRTLNAAEPFTFTAFADEGIPGPSLDRDPSLLPESDWGMWNNGCTSGPTRCGMTRRPTAPSQASRRWPSRPPSPRRSGRLTTAPPTWWSAPRGRPATAGPARTRPTATSAQERAAARPWSGMPRRRSARGSTSAAVVAAAAVMPGLSKRRT